MGDIRRDTESGFSMQINDVEMNEFRLGVVIGI
jgi:hypothetical protein